MSYKIVTKSIEETKELAKKIISKRFPNMVICLDGDLGSGKTVFTHGVAEELKIKQQITSPTFTIIKEYLDGELPLYHMDVYRLDGDDDSIGIEEYFTMGGVVVIEWSTIIKDILPKERLDIIVRVGDNNERIFMFEPYGKKYEEICEEL